MVIIVCIWKHDIAAIHGSLSKGALFIFSFIGCCCCEIQHRIHANRSCDCVFIHPINQLFIQI